MLDFYPDKITPYTIEIELTNFCNASCEFCFHSISKREKGFMDLKKLEKFLLAESFKMKDNWFNKKIGKKIFPKLVFAGLGEALIHPQVFEALTLSKKLGFQVQLVTNGLLLTEETIKRLVDIKIDEVCISLHSLNEEIYKNITNLDLSIVLPRVENAIKIFQHNNIHVEIWRVKPSKNMKRENEEDKEKFKKWESNYKNLEVLGPSEPWNRDDTITSICEKVIENPDGEIWCHKIFFTYNIAWNGDIILCCNDFNRRTVNLGNAFKNNFNVDEIKREILFNNKIPEICKNCRRWKDEEYQIIKKKYKIK